jgi:hypothetical protein
MRIASMVSALLVVVGGSAGYVLIVGKPVSQKTLAAVEIQEIPKLETARLYNLIAPSSDGIAKTLVSPIPQVTAPSKSKSKTKRAVGDKKINMGAKPSKPPRTTTTRR